MARLQIPRAVPYNKNSFYCLAYISRGLYIIARMSTINLSITISLIEYLIRLRRYLVSLRYTFLRLIYYLNVIRKLICFIQYLESLIRYFINFIRCIVFCNDYKISYRAYKISHNATKISYQFYPAMSNSLTTYDNGYVVQQLAV
jgi:hypothetical protein